jgi:hypothetical protein
MHFHLPKPLHGWREFVGEVGIIVVGVLIALSAEQVVDDWQWARKLHASEDAMRTELLFDDGPQAYHRAAIHNCLQHRLAQIRAGVETRASRAELVRLTDGYELRFLSYDTVAHEAASHADIADHMSADRVKTYTDAYAMMPYMERTNASEADKVSELHAYARTGGPLTEDERARILSAVESLKTYDMMMFRAAGWALPSIRRLGPLDPGRMRRFDAFARTTYGRCVRVVPADWTL